MCHSAATRRHSIRTIGNGGVSAPQLQRRSLESGVHVRLRGQSFAIREHMSMGSAVSWLRWFHAVFHRWSWADITW